MRKVSKVMLALVLALSFYGTASASDTQGGILRIGTESSFPPFAFRDDTGNLAGFDVDLARTVASRLNKEAVFVDMAFDALLPALSAGKIDMIAAGLSVTPERSKRADFSRPYFFTHDAIVTRKGEAWPGDADRLKGRRVTVQAGTIQDEYLTSMGEVEILRFQRAGEALRRVLEGGADASFMDGVSVERYLADDPVLGEGLMVAFSGRITAEAMGFAVRKIDGVLLEEVNAALEALSAEGYLDDLGKKWFRRS
ncbi:MAG: transporter substrate-binding domain-containing protein [Thermovirgaceae bacterium]